LAMKPPIPSSSFAAEPWLLLAVLAVLGGCASRNYTYYLVDPAPQKHPAVKDDGALTRPFGFGSTTVMKVRWNDGNLITEVDVPILSSGQRIVVEHAAGPGDVKTIPASRVVPPPPT